MKVFVYRDLGICTIFVKMTAHNRRCEVFAPPGANLQEIDKAVRNAMRNAICDSEGVGIFNKLTQKPNHISVQEPDRRRAKLNSTKTKNQQAGAFTKSFFFIPITGQMYALKKCLLYGIEYVVVFEEKTHIDYERRVISCIGCEGKTRFADKFAILYKVIAQEARRSIPVLVSKVASKFSICPTDITVKRIKEGWGQITPKKGIQLDIQLVQLPIELQRCEVVRQLTRLLYSNSADREDLLNSAIPNYSECCIQLNKYTEYKAIFT